MKRILRFIFSLTIISLASLGQMQLHSQCDTTSIYSVNGVELLQLNKVQTSIFKSSLPVKERELITEATENEVEENEAESSKRFWLESKFLTSLFYVHFPWCFSHPCTQAHTFIGHLPASLSFKSLFLKFEVFRI